MTLEPTNESMTFLQTLTSVLMINSGEIDFGIQQLCRSMLMSRTELHRKMIKYTGRSTSIFVREFRLHKAKELLMQTDLPIQEVAYQTGFSDHCYFTKCFKKKYGLAPSKLRRQPIGVYEEPLFIL